MYNNETRNCYNFQCFLHNEIVPCARRVKVGTYSLIWNPKLESYLHDRGLIAGDDVLCVVCFVLCISVWWFVGGGSVSFKVSSEEQDGVRGWTVFDGTTQTLSCHENVVSSAEYQPAAYSPRVIAVMKMRPHLKYMGAGAGPTASWKPPCGPIRVAENDVCQKLAEKHYKHLERIMGLVYLITWWNIAEYKTTMRSQQQGTMTNAL